MSATATSPHRHLRHAAAPYPALLIIFLLVFAFLVHWLDYTPLWADEGWTIQATDARNPFVTVRDWVAGDVHPPLFFVTLDVWRVLFGDTLFALRYYSVLLSMVGVAVMFRLGRALYATRAGLLAALFYGLHDLVKVLSQEVRHYPLQMLLVAAALWLYWRFWRRPTRRRGIAFAVCGAALLYTHYWGGFVLLGLAVHALLTQRKRLFPFVVAFGGVGLLFMPWLPVLLSQITLERPFGLPHALENGRYVYAVLIYQLVGVPELFWLVLCVAGLVGAFSRNQISRVLPTPASLLPLPILVLAPVLSVLLNTVYPTLSFRSLAVAVPPVMLLAAHGLSRFRMPEQGFIIAFIVLYSLSKTSAQPLERPPWPQVAEYLGQHTTAQDAILLELNSDVDPMSVYLRWWDDDLPFAWSERVRLTEMAQADGEPLDEFSALLRDSLAGGGGAWVAQFGWEAEKDIRPWLEGLGYTLSAPTITLEPGMPAPGASMAERPFGFIALPPGQLPYRYNDGRPIMLWRLDSRPTTPPLATYGDVLRLLRAEVTAWERGVTVNLLWSPLAAPESDITVSAILLRDGAGAANHDSYPLNGLSPTSAWAADGVYFDSHFIDTAALLPGTYAVAVQVYRFTDASFSQIEPLLADDCSADAECRFIIIGNVVIE